MNNCQFSYFVKNINMSTELAAQEVKLWFYIYLVVFHGFNDWNGTK